MVALLFHIHACEAGQISFPGLLTTCALVLALPFTSQQVHSDSHPCPGLCVSVTAVHSERRLRCASAVRPSSSVQRACCHFSVWILLFPLSFWGMFIHSRWESFVLYVVCKYFLSVSALSLFPSYSKCLLQSIFAFSLNFDFIISWVCFLCLIFCFLILACLWVSWIHF